MAQGPTPPPTADTGDGGEALDQLFEVALKDMEGPAVSDGDDLFHAEAPRAQTDAQTLPPLGATMAQEGQSLPMASGSSLGDWGVVQPP